MSDILTRSIAVQDQEWAEARHFFATNPEAAARLTLASVAEDAHAVTKLMQSDDRYAEVVQRCLCLVIVEVLNRRAAND